MQSDDLSRLKFCSEMHLKSDGSHLLKKQRKHLENGFYTSISCNHNYIDKQSIALNFRGVFKVDLKCNASFVQGCVKRDSKTMIDVVIDTIDGKVMLHMSKIRTIPPPPAQQGDCIIYSCICRQNIANIFFVKSKKKNLIQKFPFFHI